jgi:hypothetical protein
VVSVLFRQKAVKDNLIVDLLEIATAGVASWVIRQESKDKNTNKEGNNNIYNDF